MSGKLKASIKGVYAATAMMLGMSLVAHTKAEIISYEKGGELIAPTQNVFQSLSELNAYISAGIDREIKIEVTQDGDVVSSYTTKRIGVNDRFEINGSSFYGLKTDLPDVPDGVYKVRISIIASDGNTVKAIDYPIQIHSVGPEISGQMRRSSGRGTMDVLTEDGYGEGDASIEVQGVTSPVGIDRAELFVVR